MKLRTSFLTRFLALAMALVMLASSANLGLVARVFAAETGKTITDGELVANNYASLSEAEKALLKSGLLVGATHEYNKPTDADNLVTVDPVAKTVKAASFENWKAASAWLETAEGEKEEIALDANGNGTIAGDHDAYTVFVTYELTIDVDTTLQTTLLSTAGWLKQGIANTDAIYDADFDLGTVALAVDALVKLADGMTFPFGTGSVTVQFGEEAAEAARELKAQVAANGNDMLDLMAVNQVYNNAASKTEYLLKNGAAMLEEAKATYQLVKVIVDDGLLTNQLMLEFLKTNDRPTYNQLRTLNNDMSQLVEALEVVINDSWTILEKDVLADDVDYAKLDDLVAALETISNVTVSGESLKADSATVKFGASMSEVNLVAEIEYYENGEKKSKEWTGVVTLSDKDINEAKAKAEAEAKVYTELTAWAEGKLDLNQHFARNDSYDEENLTYTIAFAPKSYEVTYDYKNAEMLEYGVQITLPRHSDGSKAYDYEVNGVAYAQGSVITVAGETTITREEGKAYTTNDLLTVIVGNGYGNAKTNAILSSGALYGNETIAVRYPDANKGALADFKAGSDTVIAAKPYAADYNGLSWAPYKYVVDGGETKFFGGKTEVDAGSFKTSVEVYFRLTLTNYGAAETQKWMDLAVTLETEAAAQKAAMDGLASSYDTMGQLDKTKLGALNGVIDVTDFTPDDGTDADAETLRLRGEFKKIVGSIINEHLDPDNKLKIYNMLGQYNGDGLVYYYTNYDAIKAEIDKLSGYLNGLLEEEEALKIMVSAAGFPEYAEKITDLGGTLDEAKAALSAPNPAIDLRDTTKVTALVNALTLEGEAGTAKDVAAPYLDDNAPHTVNAKGYKGITVTVKKGETGLAVSEQWTIEHVLTEDDIDALKAKVNAKIAELLGDDAAFYTGNYKSADLDALVGVAVADLKKVAYEYEWTLKTASVTVPGMEGQSIDKNNATITLAPSTDPTVRYEYYLNGKKLEGTTYTFTAEELAAIFAGEAPKFERKEINLGAETFEKFVKNLNEKIGRDDAAVYQNGTLTVNISTSELQGFVMGLVMDSGYSYIGLGSEGLVYLNEGGSLEISIQTLINAILNEKFNNSTIVDLADGSGTLTTTTMDLGGDKATATAYPFVLKLSGIPAEARKIAEILELGYIKLNGTSDHELNIELNLPEKLYQAYLTALIATGEVDLKNVAEVNNIIAVQFLWDYADGIITNDDITTATYENTLKKLGRDFDLTKYEDYYQKARTAIQKYLVVENGQASINFVDTEETQLMKKLMDKVMAGSDMGTLLGMIKEYNGGLTFSANVTVAGIINDYEALIVDTGAAGVEKFDYTRTLAGTKIKGNAVVILLKDTAADLTFPATAILDLNGFALTGDVKSNGNLVIIDSDMDTFNGGSVNGNVSGNVTIVGGTYTADVSGLIKNGYVQNETGTVHNTMFSVAQSEAGDITYSINASFYNDIMNVDVKSLAIDMAGDLLMNYFTAACLELEGQKIYGVALDDMIAILTGEGADGKIDAVIEDLLNSVNVPGISNFVNAVIADVLDFKTISENIGNAPIATYKMVTAPWAVEINHVQDEDYLTVGIGYGEKSNDYSVSLEIVGENRAIKEVRELTTALAEIVTDNTVIAVDLKQPTYNAGSNTFNVTGSAKAIVEIDLTKNENYTTVLAVILANGTGKTNYVDAINANDMDALKVAVDATTVADVIKSLKALSRDVNFATMAKNVNANVTADAAALEAVYHIYLTVAGAVLDRLEITGGNQAMGGIAQADGWYVLEKDNDIIRIGDVSAKGYTVKYDLSVTDLRIAVKIFGEVEPPVEEVAPIVVTDTEGNKVYEGESFLDAMAAVKEGYTITINEAVVADGGATVICNFNVIGADKLDMGTNYLVIGNTDYSITSDADNLNVAANVDGYRAAYVDGAYKLVEFDVVVTMPTVADCWYLKETDTRYIFLDAAPRMGLSLNDLENATIAGFTSDSIEASIAGNAGEGLVKNGDEMTVDVYVGSQKVAYITYTVIVVGDVSANGLVQSGDATMMMNIYVDDVNGVDNGYTRVQRLAADAYYNGAIQSGDATRIMYKYQTVMAYGDSAEAQAQGWNDWLEIVKAEKN